MTRRTLVRFLPFLAISPILALSGCSGPKTVVRGSVTFDGKPVGGAGVVFAPVDPKASLNGATVRTKDDGTFEFAPSQTEFALKPGKYAVFITRMLTSDGKVPSEEALVNMGTKKLHNQFPARYSDRNSPVFTVDIKDGTNELPPFEVKSK